MKRFKEFGFLTMAFLVLLRLAIGWHFLFEGVHKLDSFVHGDKPFSSAGYFREAPGPLAWEMRQLVGDPDDEALARLTMQPAPAGEDQPAAKGYLRTPPALDRDWEAYRKQYADAHDLTPEQRDETERRLHQNEDAVVQWLTMPWDPNLKREAPDDFDAADEQLKKLNARQTQLTATDAAINARYFGWVYASGNTWRSSRRPTPPSATRARSGRSRRTRRTFRTNSKRWGTSWRSCRH